jgi:hypothetical protein
MCGDLVALPDEPGSRSKGPKGRVNLAGCSNPDSRPRALASPQSAAPLTKAIAGLQQKLGVNVGFLPSQNGVFAYSGGRLRVLDCDCEATLRPHPDAKARRSPSPPLTARLGIVSCRAWHRILTAASVSERAIRRIACGRTSPQLDAIWTEKMLAALGLLIDAALTAEYTRSRTAEVVPFPPAGAGRASWKVKKTFGNRGESPQS